MNSNNLRDPNLNADIYRNMTPADRPPVPDKNLQFITIYNEKSAILGGSNMTDRYWSGTLWFYDTVSDFNKDQAFFATKIDSGVCDGVFLDHNKFIIGEDSGVLQVFTLEEKPDTNEQQVQCVGYACLHDNSLLTLSPFSDKSHVISGGMDYCIKIWDVPELIATYSFDGAHTDIVTRVDAQPKCNGTFISTSLDGEALIWDIRQSKPAKCILKKDSGLTAANWNSVLDHIVAIGTEDGNIILLDIRKTDTSNVTKTVLQQASVFPRSVHKVLFNPNPERSGELACCCDDVLVQVLDINNNLSSMYKSEEHTDFVRGLAWDKDVLYSCSWDDRVLTHKIRLCDNE